MIQPKRPVVLTIDDDDQNATELKLQKAVDVLARKPDEVTTADLKKANVILVDYQLEDWPGRQEVHSISLQPGNGVALAAVLRSQVEEHIGDQRRAFAIHSGKLDELSGGLPALSREHAIARTLNLEWVFSKRQNQKSPKLDVQVAALAGAVKALPRKWPENPEKAQRFVSRLLATPPQQPWGSRAAADVETCHPPIHEWAASTHGMALLRWLLHQVLPYPSFLWEDRYLAARLCVKVESLRQALASESKARRVLEPLRYKGVLAEFLGDRWWRAGVEHMLWEWTDGEPFNAVVVRDAVQAHVSKVLEPLKFNRPVVCVDPQSFRPLDQTIDVINAVEIKPDDWPAYAEQAWVHIDSTKDEGIAALVVPQDRHRIESAP
ncbi:MAG: hypothetical protein DMF56_04300 [Acidobacteria bacterium]|nr:MAG: hypothetical protein DMF56_04300 [Acidobacteriota bacterium]